MNVVPVSCILTVSLWVLKVKISRSATVQLCFLTSIQSDFTRLYRDVHSLERLKLDIPISASEDLRPRVLHADYHLSITYSAGKMYTWRLRRRDWFFPIGSSPLTNLQYSDPNKSMALVFLAPLGLLLDHSQECACMDELYAHEYLAYVFLGTGSALASVSPPPST